MKIAYLGNFEPTHSTETHLSATLESLGHLVDRLQENKIGLYEAVERINQTDLFLWTRTKGFLQCDGHELLGKVRVKSASYHLDLYNKISRLTDVPSDAFWKTDVVFTPDGGSEAFFMEHGINHYFLRAGVYDQECYLLDDQPDMDVTFVGSLPYHPEWFYRPKLVGWLAETYRDRFHKFGNPQKTVRGNELNQVYARSKVVVGDTLCPGFNHPYYWSDRVYETMGRGGFIIHPWIKGLQDEFIDGVHLRYYEYDNLAELKRLIDYYLKHDHEREVIRRAGHEQVKNGCTYKHRLTEALRIVQATKKKVEQVQTPVEPKQSVGIPLPYDREENLAPEDDWIPPVLRKWAL